MLIIHEVMGRNCGWLTAATAQSYRKLMDGFHYLPEFGLTRDREEVHAVYVPEMAFDVKAEAARLRAVMDKNDCVNIFVSEGACLDSIIAELEAKGEEVPRDAFGHPRLDKVNVGNWFAKQFGEMLGAEKTMVQKSGYYSRAAAPITQDKELIQACAKKGVECALAGNGGVVGQDEDKNNELRAIEFPRIKGGKPFDIDTPWFKELLAAIGQPAGTKVAVKH